MSAEQFSPDSFDPINLEAEIEAVRSLELRDFTRLKVDAKLGDVVLGCLYYQPEEATDDTPIGIVKGLGAPRAVYLGLAEAIAKRGRPAFIYKAPRKQPLSEALSPEHLSDPLVLQMTAVRYAMQALHNSERVTELRGDNAVTQIDLAGHSMGNYIAVGAAYHDTVEKPNENVHVRTLTSVAGASLDSYSSFKELRQPGEGRLQQMRRLAHRLPDVAMEEIIKGAPLILKSSPVDIWKDAVKHVFRLQTILEIIKIATAPNVDDKVTALREAGMPYGALLPEDDKFFHYDRVLSRSGHLLDAYGIIEGANHVYPNTHPEEFASYLIAMTNVLNAKKNAK